MSYFWKYFSRESREKRKEDAIRVDSEIKELRDKTTFEKGDTLAILIAAFTTLVPYCLIGVGIFVLIIMLLFRAF